jgi:hypothetical protein
MKPKGLAPVAVNSIHSNFGIGNDNRDRSVGRYNPNSKNIFSNTAAYNSL